MNRERPRRFLAGALPHRQTGPTLAGSAPEPFPVLMNRERLRRFLAGALPHRQTGPTLAGSAPEPFPVLMNRERLRRFLAGALPHRQTGPTLAGSAPEPFPVLMNRERLRRFLAGALPHRQTGSTLAGSARASLRSRGQATRPLAHLHPLLARRVGEHRLRRLHPVALQASEEIGPEVRIVLPLTLPQQELGVLLRMLAQEQRVLLEELRACLDRLALERARLRRMIDGRLSAEGDGAPRPAAASRGRCPPGNGDGRRPRRSRRAAGTRLSVRRGWRS